MNTFQPSNDLVPIGAFDSLVFEVLKREATVVGITAPSPRSGTSTVARMVAESLSRIRNSAVLVDLSRSRQAAAGAQDWQLSQDPAYRPAANWSFHSCTLSDQLVDSRALSDPESLRALLAEASADYSFVVLDLPALLDSQSIISPISAASVCDAVFLVCRLESLDRPDLASAMSVLSQADCKLAGVVSNEVDRTPPASEIARSLGRFLKFSPGLSRRFHKAVSRSWLLRD